MTDTHLSLPRLFSDQPDRSDELYFEFDGLAKTLAQLALNPDNPTPFTVVVRGGWGRGKTTLLRRAQALMGRPAEATSVKDLRRVETLWFNAWKYPDEDTVLAGLLGQLLDNFRRGDRIQQFKELALAYRGSLVGKVLRMAAPVGLKELVSGEGFESRFSEAEKKRAFHDTFRGLFVLLSRLLFDGKLAWRDVDHFSEETLWTADHGRRHTLAVFLDDLDRCRPERVREVLEAVNLFLDLPGVCFFLGVDWRRLVMNLPEEVKAQGDEYLEKIIQVVLELPVVSEEKAGEFIRGQILDTVLHPVLMPADGADETDLVGRALESRHPRHVKRFLNDLSLILGVLENTGKLGDGAGQAPAAAVLTWHLLSEILPEAKWREVRASRANAEAFVRQARVLLDQREEPGRRRGPEDGDESEEELEEWQRRIQRLLPEHHLLGLLRLVKTGGLDTLVYLATPAETEMQAAGRSLTSDLHDLHGGAWVQLEAAEPFLMGSEDGRENEKPVHPVKLSPYWISRHLVTNADYAAYVDDVGLKEVPEHWEGGEIPEGKERHPVVHVSWRDAQGYCAWLTRELEAWGEKGTAALPTEAQWEFAARGHEGRTFPWGEEEPDEERGNFGSQVEDTTPVGAYPKGATEEGIHDLAGNVWEWCLDHYAARYVGAPQEDPIGPGAGRSRVARGAAFGNVGWVLRGAYRRNYRQEYRGAGLGFRVVFRRHSS